MSLQNQDFLSDDASPSKSPPELSCPPWKNSMLLISTIGLALLLLAVAVAVVVWFRKKNKQTKRLTSILDEEKNELEKQKSQLSGVLKTVTEKREENKKRLQSVEAEITERQQRFEKPEELLREKERLLNTEWKFDKEKEMCEREMLNREKLLEPIEDCRHLKAKNKKKNTEE